MKIRVGLAGAAIFLSLVFRVQAQNAPYVNAAVADSEFAKITNTHMNKLRSLKILFGSRSFGYNLRSGLASLANGNSMYQILGSYVNYDVFSNGGDVNAVAVDAFDHYHFVHFMCTASPWTTRNYEFDDLIRAWPHHFSDDINVALLYYHGGDVAGFNVYSPLMDSLVKDYPHIRFVYVTGGYEAGDKTSHNSSSAQFGDLVRAQYQGNEPLYDLARILNDDDRCGDQYCDEYSTDPAGVHPNTTFIQERMGKGFLVMLYKLYYETIDSCVDLLNIPPAGLAGEGKTLHATRLTWDPVTACYDRYLIKRDGVVVGESFGPGFTDRGLAENTEYSYQVAITSVTGDTTDYCTEVRVRTLNDSLAPFITQVPTTIRATAVDIYFSEALDTGSATLAANYQIDNSITVLAAKLSEKDVVTLTTTTLTEDITYTLTVNQVADLSANRNTIAANSQATFKYSLMSVADDYVGYWTFDNNLNDASANTNHGTWNGTASYTGTGVAGQALAFDNTTDGPYVLIKDDGNLDGQLAFTVCLWAAKKDASLGGRLLHKHVSYFLNISANQVNGYTFNRGGVRGNFTYTATGINDTAWHHYALTYDGDSVRVYVDGQQMGVSAQDDSLANNTRDVYVGKDPWGSSFNGYIDELRVYHWALSAGELNEVMTGVAANRDSLAVRALLDANGDSRLVSGVATFDSVGRVTALNIQTDLGGSISSITSHIGQLTELKLLHGYGPANHDHTSAHLTSVDPAIGNCTKLQEVLLNDNDLTDLPLAITGLQNLAVLSVGNNLLCGISDSLKTWLDANDPDWESTQVCTTGLKADARGPRTEDRFRICQEADKIVISRHQARTPMQVDIHAVQGELVYSIQGCVAGQLIWHTSGMKSGLYMVIIQADNLQYSCKLVICN